MTKNKVALITGASKGIGRAIALGLAKMNYQCLLIGRDSVGLKSISNEIISNGCSTPTLFQLDITDSAQVKETFESIVFDFGRLDVLVNNAGIYIDGTSEIEADDFSKMIDTNVTAQYSILNKVVPIMKEQKSGYIFNIASRAGKIGFAGSGAYSASKFALVGLNESLYRELNPLGISVTAICPGWVNTQMAYKAGTKLEGGQMIQPEDIFGTIKWLLSLTPGACVKEVVIETPFSIS